MPGVYGGRLSIFQSCALDDLRLNPVHILTLATLGRYSDPEGWCWPSTEEMAQHRGVSHQAISKSIKHLVDCGYVKILPNVIPSRRDDHRGRPGNKYRLILDFVLPEEYNRYRLLQPQVAKPDLVAQSTAPISATSDVVSATKSGIYATSEVAGNDPQERPTGTTHRNDPQGATAGKPPASPRLDVLVDAFRAAKLPDPYLEAGNARSAQTLLKTWSPAAVAEMWQDVKVLHLWGTTFEADRLTFSYVAQHNLMEAWSTWKAKGKPLQNGGGNGHATNAISGGDYRGGGRQAVPGHPGAERQDAQGPVERPMAKYNDGTPILRAQRAERLRLAAEAADVLRPEATASGGGGPATPEARPQP